jgi:hypothetical protein
MAARLNHWLRRVLLEAARQRRAMGEGERRAIAGVLSVLIAIMLWFTFSMREQYSVAIEMPLEVGRLPEGRALRTLPPAQARVTVQGAGWELLKLQRTPPPLTLHALDEQVDVFAAASESPRLPAGLSVQSVTPATVRLELDPVVTRAVPVRLVVDVDPAPLYDLHGSPRVVPDTVYVTGARSVVLPLESFPTAPLARGDVRQTITARLPLADTLRGLVRTHVASVEATVPVALFTEASRELVVHVEGAPPGAPPVILLPPRVRVTYRIPVEQYERSRRTPDFYVFVPYATVINDTTGTLQPVAQLPANLSVRDLRIDPRRLRYRVRID